MKQWRTERDNWYGSVKETPNQGQFSLKKQIACSQQWLSMLGPTVCGALLRVFSWSGKCFSILNETHAYDSHIKAGLGGRGREEWWNPQLLTESYHKMLASNSYVLILGSWISLWCGGFLSALTSFLKKLRGADSTTFSYSEINGKFPTGLNLTVLEAVKTHDGQWSSVSCHNRAELLYTVVCVYLNDWHVEMFNVHFVVL